MRVSDRIEFTQNFLKKHNAYEAWVIAIGSHRHSRFVTESEAICAIFDSPQCTMVFQVFRWADTEQGYRFWEELNTEWIKQFKK